MGRWLTALAFSLASTTCASVGPAGDGSPVDGGAVHVIVEPGDGGQALRAALRAARRSIHMTMYLLTDDAIVAALVERRRAGVDVKVVLNRALPGGATPNASAFATLSAAGVAVAWAPSAFRLTHAKTIVVDGSAVWIMTMNATASAPSANREYLAEDENAADVREAEALFDADFRGAIVGPAGPLVVAPAAARGPIEGLIASAVSRVDFEVEEVSDSAITAATCGAASRGVAVHGVVPAGADSQAQATAVARLASCGASIRRLATPYVHAKALVVDGVRAYVGSENFSAASLDDNREIGLVTSAPSAVGVLARQIAVDYSAAVPRPP